jgi:type I restriction enzyme M protein
MRQQVNGLFNREELKDVKIPLPSLEIQKEIVEKIKEEEQLIAANKKLVEIFEKKIADRINQIWGC